MTSPPPPAPSEGKTPGNILRPLRDLAAYALVGVVAVLLFVALVGLIPDGDGYRVQVAGSFGSFINLATLVFPIGAVLLALVVEPRHPKANLIVLAALVEYAVMALFGTIFGLFLSVVQTAEFSGLGAFKELLTKVAWLGLLGLAGFAVFQIWRGLFAVAKPAPMPGMYGQPPQYNPGAYPGQPGYAPQPQGQPGYPPQAQAQPGYPPQPQGQPGYPPQPGFPTPDQTQVQPPYGTPAPPPGMYGAQPQPPMGQPPMGQPPMGQPPAWNQPAVHTPPVHSAPPASAPPASAPPASAPPASAPPASAPPAPVAGPFPPQPADFGDRTAKIGDDRPGFGPADQDPPRY